MWKSESLLALMLLVFAGPALAQESLIDPDSFRGPAADRRAFREGDLLTVYVLEAARARSGASTDAASELGIRVSVDSPNTDYSAGVGLTGSNGVGAETARVGELRAQISVRVVGLQPGGVLEIAGEQVLVVNGERQQIRLSGLVRPEDVSADNSVWSHRIADANVELTGAGVVSASQRQSVIYRLFKWLRLM